MLHRSMFFIMSKKNCFLFLVGTFVLLSASKSTSAQVKDAGLWLSLNAEKKITSKLSATLSQEFRMNENITELGTAFTEAGIEYKIFKKGFVGLSYRFIQKRKVDDFYSLRHRINVDAGYRFKVTRMSLTVRERFQTQYSDVNTSPEGHIPEYYLRSKLTFKYNLEKKYTPFMAAELFYQLNNAKGNEIDNIRYSAGFDYEINKLHSLEVFYLINKEVNVNDPWTEYIIGIGYKYAF